ncbi:hypothetical protein ACFY8O_29995 [Streptomyces argenteolus]|uniref:Uncharacterized protein n=1 Tax=Streptomyces argenteolus TaxID=67274 RepID=A0ABW6XEF6_9ACTN
MSSFDGTLALCVSADLHHTGASVVVDGSGRLSCLDRNFTGAGRVTWADTGTVPSEYVYTGGVSLRPDGTNVLVLIGTSTADRRFHRGGGGQHDRDHRNDPTACLSFDGPRTAVGEFNITSHVVCGGNQTTTYSPSLINTPQAAQRSGTDNHTPCVSTLPPFAHRG